MKSPRKYFFTFILFLLPGIIFSQQRLKVVKDNIACTYGLKNDSGKWVIPAQYSKITTTNNWIDFIVTSGEKSGVVDNNGKMVLPVLYDHITTIGYPKVTGFMLSLNGKYGVLDSIGNPVIPFEYDEMNAALWKIGAFVVKKNSHWGILDQKGKIKLPLEYSEIKNDENGYGYYLTKKKNENNPIGYRNFLMGYGDSSGVVIPCMYQQVKSPYTYYNRSHQNLFIVIDSSLAMHHGVVNNKNEIILPFNYDNIWLSEGYGADISMRLIAKKEGRNGSESFGVFEMNGKEIIAPGTKIISNDASRYSSDFSVRSIDTIAAKQNQKWGLMTGNGIWVTPQDYDSIILPEYVPRANELRWMVLKNKKYGTLSANGKIFIPVEYDVLKQENDNNGRYNNYSDARSDNSYYFIGKKNGKNGLTSSDGKGGVPYIYDTVIENYREFYFTNKTEALYFKRAESNNYGPGISAEAYPLKYFFKISNSLLVYKSQYTYYAFEDSTTKGKLLLPTEVSVYNDEDNEKLIDAIVCHEETDHWNYPTQICDTLTYDKTGKLKVNPLRGIEIVNYYHDNIIFRSKEKKLGIISKTGKIIKPAIYYGLQPMEFENHSYLWIKFQHDSSCAFFHDADYDCACGWTLCDSLFRPVCKTLFDYPFMFLSNPQPVYVNGKAGLFDINKKSFLISPRYADMISINGNPYRHLDYSYGYPNGYSYGYEIYGDDEHDYNNKNLKLFYVLWENGKFGIADSTGKWISDSTFTEMMPVPKRNNLLCKGGKTELFSANRYLLTGNSVRMIMDENGVMAKNSSLIDSLLTQTFVMNDFQYGYYSVGDGGGGDNTPSFMRKGPAVIANAYSKNMEASHWQDSLVAKAMIYSNELLMNKYKYQFVSNPFENNSFKCLCSTAEMNPQANYSNIFVTNNYKKNYRYNNYQSVYNWKTEITFLAPQGFSLLLPFNPDSSDAAKNYQAPFYLNFRKTENGFIPCTLDSIFCKDVNYAFVLNKLIIEAIKKRDDLNLDCNNPAGWFFLSHGRYCFTKDGLQFTIENNNKASNGDFNVIIPWKEIQPYSRPGGIVDDFVGNNLGEHCKPAYDSTVIDFNFQKYFHVNDFANSDFLKREKFISCSYFITDDGKINGMRFCCEGNVVYDVYFENTKEKNLKQFLDAHETATLNGIPNKIRKRKITKMICIKNFPCN